MPKVGWHDIISVKLQKKKTISIRVIVFILACKNISKSLKRCLRLAGRTSKHKISKRPISTKVMVFAQACKCILGVPKTYLRLAGMMSKA